MVRALTFADRSVNDEVDQVYRRTTAIILEAMGHGEPAPCQLSAVRVIEHTWHAALIAWLSGRAATAQVRTDLETVCRLLDPPPGPGHSGTGHDGTGHSGTGHDGTGHSGTGHDGTPRR
jgi:hypothetical protein